MRAVSAIILALATIACRIPNETFAVGDGGADAAPDGPPPPTGFIYVVDPMSGIYVVTHTAAGALALAPIQQPQLVSGPLDAVANAAGTKLYALQKNAAGTALVVADYDIQADGSLTAGGSIGFSSSLPSPSPIRLAITPNSKFIAVAIQTLDVSVIKLDATGAMVSMSDEQFQMLMGSSTSVAFSADSRCIFITSGGSFVAADFSTTGGLGSTTTIAGPAAGVATAVDPIDQTTYVGGGATMLEVHGYARVGNCGLTTNTTTPLAMTSPPYAVLLDATNHRLYAPGKNVAVFDVSGAVVSNGRSGVAQGSATTGGAALDDNGILYVSGPGYTDVASGHTAVVSVGLDGSGKPVILATANLPVAAQPVSLVHVSTAH